MKQLASQDQAKEPPKGLVSVHGDLLSPVTDVGPQTCCVLLMALTAKAPMVPDDFHNVTITKAGLEAYVRPDGAIYLGAFELPNDPYGTVCVWGDPAMSFQQAAAASIAYRRKLLDHHMGSDLGPFSASPILES
jgi:hypothetical protein